MSGRKPDATVPCGTCTACCRAEAVVLNPEDGDPRNYDAVPCEVPTRPGQLSWMLKHKPNGDCIYLGMGGCTIYARRPVMCRTFDCRLFYLNMGRKRRKEAVAAGWVEPALLEAGLARLHTLNKTK